jgi:DNA-binding transcriptional ArsR family regulator
MPLNAPPNRAEVLVQHTIDTAEAMFAFDAAVAAHGGGRRTVGELAGNFRTSRPAISKHLRLLRSAGLVVTHQQGTARICELNAKPLRAVNDWLRDYEAFWSASLRDLKRYVEKSR